MIDARARTHHPLFFVLFVLLITCVFQVTANPDELTVLSDKSSYTLGGAVDIYGRLTIGGSPVTNGLVAVQITDSSGNVLVVRTLPTGTLPPPWKVRFVNFFSCDSQGNPVASFASGSFSYFKATVQNMDPVLDRSVTLTINVLDTSNLPIGIAYIQVTVPHGQSLTYMTALKIPDDANAGSAVAYANVYTKWPKSDGYPYCPEVSAVFTITGSGGSLVGKSQTSGNPQAGASGSYNLAFTLPNTARPGLYKVYVRAKYNAAAETDIDIVWLYTDVNRDGKVNILDIFDAAKAFGYRKGDPKWNGYVDQNGDGLINILDVFALARDFGKSLF